MLQVLFHKEIVSTNEHEESQRDGREKTQKTQKNTKETAGKNQIQKLFLCLLRFFAAISS
jgi:hypothetical protein